MLSLSQATMLSTTLAGILYGFSLYMFIVTFGTLFRNYGHRRLNYGMIASAVSLLMLSTAEMVVNFTRLNQGFITKGPNLPGGPEDYFSLQQDVTYLAKSCLYNAQTIILDAVVIYRTFVVWQNCLVIIVPILGWFCLIAACIGLNISLATTVTDIQTFHATRTRDWITAAYSLTLATNLLTTFLLAFRIWRVARRSAHYMSGSSLTPILRVVIESGAIYSLTITAALVTFVLKSNAVNIILDMISPLISIVFCMLIVRVGTSTESDNQHFKTTQWTRTWIIPATQETHRDSTFQMRDITVEITEVVHHHIDAPLEDVKSPRRLVPSPEGGPQSEPPTPPASKLPASHDRDADSVEKPDTKPA